MRKPDAVLQEVWQIKDAAYERVGRDAHRFVEQLRQHSAELRRGLNLKELQAPLRTTGAGAESHQARP